MSTDTPTYRWPLRFNVRARTAAGLAVHAEEFERWNWYGTADDLDDKAFRQRDLLRREVCAHLAFEMAPESNIEQAAWLLTGRIMRDAYAAERGA